MCLVYLQFGYCSQLSIQYINISKHNRIIKGQMQINIKSFKLLHNHLLSILTTNNHEDGNLDEKILQYIEMIVESEKNKEFMQDLLDYFYEERGIVIMKQLLQIQPMLSVKCLSLLFINLKNQQFLSFLLCQPFLMKAIELDDHPQLQQWAEYFISFLKSLSIRITPQQISLFYNKKFCKFPLIYEAMKYYNHPDCMVRTNVMNIILGMMKMKNARVSTYFGSFPFTSYILTFCSELANVTEKFNTYSKGLQLEGMNEFKLKSCIKMYAVDLTDDICYLNDLHSYGSQQLNYVLENALLSYVLNPQLRWIFSSKQQKSANKSVQQINKQSQHSQQIILPNQQNNFLQKSALFTIYTSLKLIKDKRFAETICFILMGKHLPKKLLERLSSSGVYYPKVYSKQFKENSYYWDKFSFQITQECEKRFIDIANFQTDHQLKRKDLSETEHLNVKQEFHEQIHRISSFLGFDILTYKESEQVPPICPKQLKLVDFDAEQNSIRDHILVLLRSKDMDTVLAISNILILLIKSQFVPNNLLKFCGLLLPRMDTVNYLDEFNIKSLLEIKQICLNFLSNLQPQYCQVAALRNMLLLFQQCLFRQLQNDSQKKIIVKAYRDTTNYLKDQIKSANMVQIIENFEQEYLKWHNATPSVENDLPFSIFLNDKENIPQVKSHYLVRINKKEQIIRSIQMFTLMRSFYRKYLSNFEKEELPAFSKLYNEKFGKLFEIMKVGESYQIGYRSMIESKIIKNNQPKNKKTMSKVIIIQDSMNLIIVQPNNEVNQAKVLLNSAWKNIECSIDKQNGKSMLLHVRNSHQVNNISELYFQDEIRCAGTLNLLHDLKRRRYQQQQAFILNFVKNCLQQ